MKFPARSTLALLSAAAALPLALPALAQPTIRGLGFLGKTDRTYAGDLSADGTAIVGASQPLPGMSMTPVRWLLNNGQPILEALERPEGWTRCHAISTSRDGSIAVVYCYDNNTLTTYRWDAARGATLFPTLPDWERAVPNVAAPNGDVYGSATLLDGTFRPVRWPVSGGSPEVFDLPQGVTTASFGSLDDAGNIYGTGGNDPAETSLFRWTHAGPQFLVEIPRYTFLTRISSDGSSIAGTTLASGNGQHVWTWKEGRGFTPILTSPHWFTVATAVAPDGSVVFGFELPDNGLDSRFFAWTSQTGVISAAQYFADRGVDIAGWSDFTVNDISSDATRFVGGAFNPDGRAEAFIITIPRICPADFNADGDVNSQDFFDFLNDFFATNPNADFNDDGAINSQDFFDFLNVFFAPCS
jgi:uncharacterized membrane protein